MKISNIPVSFICLFMLFSCDQASNRSDPEVYTGETGDADSLVVISPRSKAMQVSVPCAVLVVPEYKVPDSLTGLQTENVDTTVDENQLYLSRAITFLDSVSIPVINQKPEGKMEFRTDSSRVYSVELKDREWQVILFNGREEPKWILLPNLSEDYNYTMKKK